MGIKLLQWDEQPKSSGNSRFKKWTDGRNKVRFLTQPIGYDKQWPDGMRTEYVAAVIDLDDPEMPVKFVSLKKAILESIRNFKMENGIDPNGKDAPAFAITKTGSGLSTSYSAVASLKTIPIPPEINLVAVQKDLEEFVAKQESKTTPSK